MTREEFWALIEAARAEDADADAVAAHVGAALAQRPAPEIYAYLEHQARLMEASYSWALWGAAYVVNGGCSDDGFDYFRGWLLAQGQEIFERVLADPDALADLVDGEVEAQDMIAVAAQAYLKVTGAYPKGPKVVHANLGPSWDFDDAAEMRARYPRLTAKLDR